MISCRYLADLSERETAAVLGCRPGTVKSRLSRALDRRSARCSTRLPEPATEPGRPPWRVTTPASRCSSSSCARSDRSSRCPGRERCRRSRCVVASSRARRTVDISSVPSVAHAGGASLVAVAVALLVVVATTLAIGKSRDAVADWLGLRGVESSAARSPCAASGTSSTSGDPVSLAEARAALGFEPLVAERAQYGAPDAIYLADAPAGGRVTFVYAPRPGLPPAAGSGVGLLITEFEATIEEPVLRKTAGPDTTVEVLDGQRRSARTG